MEEESCGFREEEKQKERARGDRGKRRRESDGWVRTRQSKGFNMI